MYFLRILRENGAESVRPLNSRTTRIGRDPANDVVLDDYGVSRNHAEVVLVKGEVLVRDLGSRNGTLLLRGGRGRAETLRGKAAAGGAGSRPLAPGDEVRVGSVRVVLVESLGDAAPDTGSPGAVAAGAPRAARPAVPLAEPETLDLSGPRAVLLLDFVARFAQELQGPPSRAAAADALERLRAFALASRIDVLAAAEGSLSPLLSASARSVPEPASREGGSLPPRSEQAARLALGREGSPRALWVAGEDEAESALALVLAEGMVLVALFAKRRGPLPTEDLRSFEVGAAIAGQFLRLVLAVEALDRSCRALAADADLLRRTAAREPGSAGIVAASPAMRRVLGEAEEAARSAEPVLLTGETGVGKEVVARLVHERGPRSGRPFVAVNCASLGGDLVESELFGHGKGAFTGAVADRAGLFELADGGTLFLDEVGELPSGAQARLLRVLEDGRFRRVGEERERSADVRVVAATNRDLAAEVRDGRFRKDLRFRLDVFHLVVPPLRERREDILPLAESFLASFAASAGRRGLKLDVDASRLLHAWSWPGNVRELRNVLGRAVALAKGPFVGAGELRFSPDAVAGEDPLASLLPLPREEAVRGFTKLYLERLLLSCGGNVSRAARAAGMDRRNLQIALARHGLKRDASGGA